MRTNAVIDAHQTYTYRVTPLSDRAAPATVTVGPPPAGYSQAAVNPKQNNANVSDLFGEYVCMVLDQNGDPMLAALIPDHATRAWPGEVSIFNKDPLDRPIRVHVTVLI